LSGDTGSLSSLGSSSNASLIVPSRNKIDQLAFKMGFGGIRSSAVHSSSSSNAITASSISLINSSVTVPPLIITPSYSQLKLESIQDVSTSTENAKDIKGAVKERLMIKIDPVEMTAKPTAIIVPQDTVKRSSMLLSGPKFRLNSKEILKDKLTLISDTGYSVSVSTIKQQFLIRCIQNKIG
jgi:hypothetical protein